MTDRILCPNCGYASSPYRATCKQCHEKLPKIIPNPPNSPQKEPGLPEQRHVVEAELDVKEAGRYTAISATKDQSHTYATYFELVQSFNSNNAEYLKIADEIATQRQRAIERAIEIHINPVLSTIRSIQIGSILAGILALLLLCGGFSLLGNSSSSSEATGSGGFGVIVLLISLGLGTLAVIAFVWTSSKISDLNNTKTLHAQGRPPNVPDQNV